MKTSLSIIGLLALAGAVSAQTMETTRLAAGPDGDAMYLRADTVGVIAYYNADPLTQPWSSGTTLTQSVETVNSGQIVYAGNGRFVAVWNANGNIYTAYTDDHISWSSPVKQDDTDNTAEAGLLAMASDGQGSILLQFNEGSTYMRRSLDGGATFLSQELQLDETGAAHTPKAVQLAANGTGSWYRAYTRLNHPLDPLDIVNSERVVVQRSLDAGISWTTPTVVANAAPITRILLGLNAVDSRAVVLTNALYYSPPDPGFALTSTSNNGANWSKMVLPQDQSSYMSSDFLFNREASIASDPIGNRVVLYRAVHPDANNSEATDFDILGFKSDNTTGSTWDTAFRYVSRQRDRNEKNISVVSIGIGKFLAAYDIADSHNSNIRGIQTAISVDAGNSWETSAFVWGSVPPGQLWDYSQEEPPEPPAKFTVNSVTPKIKYKEPKPGKPPKPRKATFKIIIGTTTELTTPESAGIKLYLSEDDTLQAGQDLELYSATTKSIKPGKSGKLNIKFNDFPDPAGKFVIIQVNGAAPYALAM